MSDPRVEVLPIEQGATTDLGNVNKHTVRGGALLENSLRKRGAFRSIASAGKGVEVPVTYAGNYTLEKAVEAGFKEIVNVHVRGDQLVNVVRDDLTPGSPEAIALGLEDNESAAKSYSPDLDILAALAAGDDAILAALRKEDKVFGGMLTGMGLKDAGKDVPLDTDRGGELAEKWKTKTGQLWELKDSRLFIGDCTLKENVTALIGDNKCGACVTDSPYGINREGIENDDPEGLRKLFDSCLANMPIENGAIINFQSPRLFPEWLDAIRAAGHKFERMIWMYKPNDVCYPWQGWLQTSEAILVSSIGKPAFVKVDPYAHDTYTSNWNNETKGKVDGWHGSIKPLPLIQDLVSRVGGDVYEPFAGSGTTIIAAHNLGRRCFAMEISEEYSAIILERFYQATGIMPEMI